MRKSIMIVLAMVFATVTFAIAASPDKINLQTAWETGTKQKAVIFDHVTHQGNNQCTDCHATADGGKFKPEGDMVAVNDKNVAHKFCWDCHTEKNVSVKKTCTKCHTN